MPPSRHETAAVAVTLALIPLQLHAGAGQLLSVQERLVQVSNPIPQRSQIFIVERQLENISIKLNRMPQDELSRPQCARRHFFNLPFLRRQTQTNRNR